MSKGDPSGNGKPSSPKNNFVGVGNQVNKLSQKLGPSSATAKKNSLA